MTKAIERTNRSPRIIDVSWGKLEVEGEPEPYKDAKLFPGGARANGIGARQKQITGPAFKLPMRRNVRKPEPHQ